MLIDFLKKGFDETKRLAKETNMLYKKHKGSIQKVGEGAGRMSESALGNVGGYPMIDATPKKKSRKKEKYDAMFYV